jgi:hypothetical protein
MFPGSHWETFTVTSNSSPRSPASWPHQRLDLLRRTLSRLPPPEQTPRSLLAILRAVIPVVITRSHNSSATLRPGCLASSAATRDATAPICTRIALHVKCPSGHWRHSRTSVPGQLYKRVPRLPVADSRRAQRRGAACHQRRSHDGALPRLFGRGFHSLQLSLILTRVIGRLSLAHRSRGCYRRVSEPSDGQEARSQASPSRPRVMRADNRSLCAGCSGTRRPTSARASASWGCPALTDRTDYLQHLHIRSQVCHSR